MADRARVPGGHPATGRAGTGQPTPPTRRGPRGQDAGTRRPSRTRRPLPEELEALGGHGRRVGSMEEARDYVSPWPGARSWLLVRWDVEELRAGVDGRFASAGVEVSLARGDDFRDPRQAAATRRHRALDRRVGRRGDREPGPVHGPGTGSLRDAPAADPRRDRRGGSGSETIPEAIQKICRSGEELPANVALPHRAQPLGGHRDSRRRACTAPATCT